MSKTSIYTVTGLAFVIVEIFVTLQTCMESQTKVLKEKDRCPSTRGGGEDRKANFSPTEIVKLVDLVAFRCLITNSYWWRARHVGVYKPLFMTGKKC